MALFSSVFRQLFEHFAHFLRRRDAPQCAAQELAAEEKLPEECEAFDCTANDRKCTKKRRKVPKKYPLGEREEEREVKINKGGSHKDEAEITQRGRVHQKKRKMHSLEKLMEGENELREAGEKKRNVRKQKEQKITEPTPLLVEVKPLHSTARSSFLKPIEDELPMLPSVSGHLTLPAIDLQRPPSRKPQLFTSSPSEPQSPTPAPDELFSIQHSSSQVWHPKWLPPSPTPGPDAVVDLKRPPSRKPQPSTSSPFEPPPQLILEDIEEEENEYVEYTGKTIRASDLLKSERPQTLEAETKPRKMVAWLEKDSEVQEEVWASEVEEVQAFKEEEGEPSEMGDSKAMQGYSDDAPQIDEPMMKLSCAASPDGPKNETQHNVNVQKKCKRKMPLLFTWAEAKAKKKEEKKIIKEKEQREKELLLERYMNDPKLKHLWINKHNRNYNSSKCRPSLFTFNHFMLSSYSAKSLMKDAMCGFKAMVFLRTAFPLFLLIWNCDVHFEFSGFILTRNLWMNSRVEAASSWYSILNT